MSMAESMEGMVEEVERGGQRQGYKERILLTGPCIILRFFMLLTQPQLVLCYGGKQLLFLLPPSIQLLLAATAAATVIKSHYPWTIVAISESLDIEKGGNLCGLIQLVYIGGFLVEESVSPIQQRVVVKCCHISEEGQIKEEMDN